MARRSLVAGTGRPAAALEGGFRARAVRIARSLPAVDPDVGHGLLDDAPSSSDPEWLQLPRWLAARWREDSRDDDGTALEDILWGQYTLFLFVRIQDDLLDGHRRDLALQFLANDFLVESLAAFRRVSGLPSGFWDLLDSSLRRTSRGILSVRALEASPGRFREADLHLHGDVGAIFGVGAAALCLLLDRPEALAWIRALQDALAVASQLGDDLRDLQDDLAGGRYTFVANAVLGLEHDTERVDPQDALRRLGPALLDPGRTGVLFDRIDAALAEARAALPHDAPPEIAEWIDARAADSRAALRSLHEVRVRMVFGDLIA